MPYDENENPLERLVAFLLFLATVGGCLLLAVLFVAWLLRMMQV